MKKTTCLFLSIVMLFCSTGIPLTLYLHKQILKHHLSELKENRRKNQKLVHFVMDTHNKHLFRFIKTHEFIYNGSYYDIVFMKKNDGHIIYECYFDKKEGEITNLMILKKDQEKQNSQTDNLAKQLSKLISIVPEKNILLPHVSSFTYLSYSDNLTLQYVSHFFPPPRRA